MNSMKSSKVARKPAVKPVTTKPKLRSGGNPQIAKADGDAPVQAYIAAMPGWKRGVGRRLDAMILRTVAGVQGGQMEHALLSHQGHSRCSQDRA
jgi:hypothetical protein